MQLGMQSAISGVTQRWGLTSVCLKIQVLGAFCWRQKG